MKGILSLVSALLLAASPEALAANRTGADFLRIGVGARAVGMGSAYTAVADDATAIYWNPAGLSRLSKREIGLMHSEWFLGTKYDFMGYAHPSSWGSLGLGIMRLSAGDLEGRGADRTASGSLSAADTAFTVGFSRLLAYRTSLGINLKYLTSRIGSDSASTVALDLGAMRNLEGKPISLGLSVQNIGRGMKFLDQRDPLPLTLSLGGAYRMAGALGMSLDLNYEPYDHKASIAVGTEYTVFSMLSLRAGYVSYAAQALGGQRFGGSSLAGLGGGIGLKLGSYQADYTFTPFGDLGNTQRVSLSVRW